MIDVFTVAAVCTGFLLGGFVKGALGLGMPVVALAVMTPLIGLKAAIAVAILPAIAANIYQALAGPSLLELCRRLWPFLAAALVGIWFGVGVLAGADTVLLEALLGTVLVSYSIYSLLTPQLPPPGRHEGWMSPLAGGLGGAIFGMTGIFIVPGILYLQTLGLGRDRFVQALGITFLTIATGIAVSLGGRDMLGGEMLALSAGAILPAFGGMMLGRRFRHQISEALFRQLFFAALVVAGGYMVLRALV